MPRCSLKTSVVPEGVPVKWAGVVRTSVVPEGSRISGLLSYGVWRLPLDKTHNTDCNNKDNVY